MREIKFRAWFEVHKKMIGAESLVFEYDGPGDGFITACDDESTDATFNAILMQYTGAKDFNGREIFDGDIVKFEDGYTNDIIDSNKNSVVIMDDFSWMLKQGDDPNYYEFLSNVYSQLIVIGNIYENPELLEGDSN